MSISQPITDTSLNGYQSSHPVTSQVGVEDLKKHMYDIAEQVESMPDPIQVLRPQRNTPNSKKGQEPELVDYKALGETLRIRPDENISPPPVCLAIKQGDQTQAFGTLGNFSVLIGKAKSRKTFTISIAIAAALKRDLILNRFAGSFDDNKSTILYFDTEQGRYHTLKVVKRICKLANQPSPENLLVYPLRGLSAQHILGFIEWHIYNTDTVGLVIIDGIKDTVSDINDNSQATERASDLLRWTQERDIHIITVLHMNKGNDQIRGTLGTELQNKAETVASIAVDPSNKDISIVTAEYCRDKDFEPFAFSIDDQGLPYILDDWQPDQRTTTRRSTLAVVSTPIAQKKSSIISQLTVDTHQAIVRRMFANVESGKYSTTWQRLKRAVEYFGHSIADNPAKELLTYYQDSGFIQKNEKGYYMVSMPTDSAQSNIPEAGDDFNPDLLGKSCL